MCEIASEMLEIPDLSKTRLTGICLKEEQSKLSMLAGKKKYVGWEKMLFFTLHL